MADIEDAARWFAGRAVWWTFASLALLVLTDVAVGTGGALGFLGVPGAALVDAYRSARHALGVAGASGAADPIALAFACYLLALVVGGAYRLIAEAWRWRRALLYPETAR